MDEQQRSADALAAILYETAGALSRSRPQQPVTAPPPEVVDAVRLLTHLNRRADEWPDLCLRAMSQTVEQGEWATWANIFRSAAQACQRLAGDTQVIDGDQRDNPPSAD